MNVIRLFSDMTFKEEKTKVDGDKLAIDPEYPELKIGNAVFLERPHSRLKFWKKRRTLSIWVDGAPSVTHLVGSNPHPALSLNFGTQKDTKRFVARLVAKALSEHKPFKTWQFIILAIPSFLSLVMLFMIMRSIGIV